MKKSFEWLESEGYVAGEHGAPREHNPHPKGSAEWSAWNRGWQDAEDSWQRSVDAMHNDKFMEGLSAFIALVLLVCAGVIVWKVASAFYHWVMSL